MNANPTPQPTPKPQFEIACADMSYEDCLALVEGDGLIVKSRFYDEEQRWKNRTRDYLIDHIKPELNFKPERNFFLRLIDKILNRNKK